MQDLDILDQFVLAEFSEEWVGVSLQLSQVLDWWLTLESPEDSANSWRSLNFEAYGLKAPPSETEIVKSLHRLRELGLLESHPQNTLIPFSSDIDFGVTKKGLEVVAAFLKSHDVEPMRSKRQSLVPGYVSSLAPDLEFSPLIPAYIPEMFGVVPGVDNTDSRRLELLYGAVEDRTLAEVEFGLLRLYSPDGGPMIMIEETLDDFRRPWPPAITTQKVMLGEAPAVLSRIDIAHSWKTQSVEWTGEPNVRVLFSWSSGIHSEVTLPKDSADLAVAIARSMLP